MIGERCGPVSSGCGPDFLQCSDQDPKGPNGDYCGVSSRRYKDDIAYAGAARLQELHDETLRIKLATYRYKPQVAAPGPTHLGFIIEDDPNSPAVAPSGDHVDLYGYVSMVVATVQVQQKEIAALREELDRARRDASTCSKATR